MYEEGAGRGNRGGGVNGKQPVQFSDHPCRGCLDNLGPVRVVYRQMHSTSQDTQAKDVYTTTATRMSCERTMQWLPQARQLTLGKRLGSYRREFEKVNPN